MPACFRPSFRLSNLVAITVSAAASLTDAMGAIAAAYTAEGGGTVHLNFAGSNALARQIVHMHGGTISASSAGPGQGAEFTVRLPLASGAPAERVAAWKARHPGALLVSYINCSAAVKALSDYIVTSSNAEKPGMPSSSPTTRGTRTPGRPAKLARIERSYSGS